MIGVQVDWSFACDWIQNNNHDYSCLETSVAHLSPLFFPDVCREQSQLLEDFEKDKKKEKEKGLWDGAQVWANWDGSAFFRS